MKTPGRSESGQSIVLIAFAFVALVALVAIVIDGANVYSQRRQLVNAVNSAAYAGGQTLAMPGPYNGVATVGEVEGEVHDYLEKNNVDPAGMVVQYVTRDAQGNPVIEPGDMSSYGIGSAKTVVNGRPVIGITVTAHKDFNSFFAGIVGIKSFTISSGGNNGVAFGSPPNVYPPGQATPPTTSNGTCCADNLFPVAYSITNFVDENGDGVRDVHFEQSDPTYTYIIWDRGQQTGAGNWGYVHWNPPYDGPDATTLAGNMNDTSHSGQWYKGDWLGASTGTMSSSAVVNAWKSQINQFINIPLYASTNGQSGSNLQYQIEAFARFKVTGVCIFGHSYPDDSACPVTIHDNSDRYIAGKFEQWVYSMCEGTCPNYGITTSKDRPPTSDQRSLVGVVKINQLSPVNSQPSQQHIPVDVVHVLDISGSMSDSFGSWPNRTVKLTAAKNALISFNSVVSPTLGDRVGLADFPKTDSGRSYSYSCTQRGSWSTYLWGKNVLNLTSNITGTNGVNSKINSLQANSGTPLAGGLYTARQMVLDPSFHDPTHAAVLVLASDGIANVLLNGQWTGFQGNTYDNVACNNQAVQDAITQANIAKADNNGDGKPDITIFTIAIGSDFNADALKAIASQPVNTHFKSVSDAGSMEDWYNSIATRVENIGAECTVKEQEAFAPNATVTIKNLDTGQTYSTTTNDTGYYYFDNIPAGTYQFTTAVTVDGHTYDTYTDGVGGPVLTSNPTIDISASQGTFDKNVYLKTNDTICN